MSYREENGQVVLTMSREDYERVVFSLGLATGFMLQDGGNGDSMRALLNRINEGNPNYTAYDLAGAHTDGGRGPRVAKPEEGDT